MVIDRNEDEGRARTMRFRSGISFFSSSASFFSWKILALFLLLIYVPFLGQRVVRPAGDDKVYVSQALEMAARGDWFVQVLNDVPDYRKGPLHYLLLRAGFILFGDSMWATVYMNLFFVLLGAISLGLLVQRRMPEFDGWPFFTGAAFALGAGVYAHMFASQMEVEVAGLFAFAIYLLDRAGPGKPDLKFWIVAGIAGWIKSPLHSVLIGVTALLFWGWTGELFPRIRNPRAWLAALVGVGVCVLGYLPAAISDYQNFLMTYIYRETLWKPPNGAPWHYPVVPLFTYYLFPWMLPAFVAYADGISRLWRRSRAVRSTAGSRRLVALGVSLVVPSVAFFIYHPYRGQNYNLPVIAGLVLFVSVIWATRSESWTKFYSAAIAFTAALALLVPLALTYFVNHFDPMPFWWRSWLLPALWIGALLTARGFWREGITFSAARPASLARRYLWFVIGLSLFLSALGNREMIDVRDRLYEAGKRGERPTVSYYNLQQNIWSEWGYLNFMIPYPVKGIFSLEGLKKAVNENHLILVPGEMWLTQMQHDLAEVFPGAVWEIEPWKRWKTKGKNAQGVPAWREAWESRDLTRLEKDFYMVRVRPQLKPAPGRPGN